MQMSQLKPASQLAHRYGVKSVLYGKPGTGKTPLMNTTPRPVLLVCEPGMLSMRKSNIPCWEGYTAPLIKEFFEWFFKSKEASSFDTLGIDSISHMAEIFLEEEMVKQKHGLKAYGSMSERVMSIANDLFYHPQKHIVLIAKQGARENGRQSMIQDGKIIYEPVMQACPFFPGKDLNVKMPHLFDNVLHLSETMVPGMSQPQPALRTKEIPEVFARSRSGTLNELEPPDFNALFAKCMNV